MKKFASIFIGLMVSGCNFRLMKDHSTSMCIRDELLQQTRSASMPGVSHLAGYVGQSDGRIIFYKSQNASINLNYKLNYNVT